MTTVFSVINMKGGVGKTTITVALAEVLASEFQKRVLVIDLDPQINTSLMLIGEEFWYSLNKKGYTLAPLFELNPNKRLFDFEKACQKEVSNVKKAQPNLDLLPSSLDLIDVQDAEVKLIADKQYLNPYSLLKVIEPHLKLYDLVIIDCPPSLGVMMLNGLSISDRFLIPSIPDFLSTYGIPQILNRIGRFKKAIKKKLDPLGIVITKYQKNSKIHKNTLNTLKIQAKNLKIPYIFNTIIPQSNDIAQGAELVSRENTMTFRMKWGPQASIFHRLAEEILEQIKAS